MSMKPNNSPLAAPAKWNGRVETLIDLAAGWLLTVSMCMVVDAQFPTQAGLWTTLWHTGLVLVLLTLLTLRWWLLPATLGVGVAVTFVVLLPWSELTASLTTVKEFFLWWFSNLPLDSPWYTPQTMYILHSLIHLGLSTLVFVLLRVFRRCWPLVVLGGGLQVFVLLVASKDNSALSLGLYLSGVFPLLARDRYSGRRMFSKKARNRVDAPRWKVSLVCGVLCIAVTGVMMVALPANTAEIRLRFAADGVADLQTLTDWYLEDQKENTELTLVDIGLQPNIYRLGGDLKPLEPLVIATTDLTEETLLKVTAFDTFTGKNWTNEFTTGYRVNGYWEDKQADYLAAPLLVDEKWASTLALLGTVKDVTVTLTEDQFLLPTMEQTLAITENTYAKSTLSFNERGELLTFTYPMTEGYSYTLTSFDLPLENNLPKEAYGAAAKIALAGNDPILADPAFFNHYTAIPDTLSEDLKYAAWDLTDGVETKLQKALMLSRYFSLEAGYVYDEAPGKTYYNDNVVDQVLREKRGYCVHYATAMAMMARAIEVPSRLAAGYRTIEGPDGTQVVDLSHPYVWVECYFQNLGWLSFDPTPGEGFDMPLQDKPNLTPEENDSSSPEEEEEPPQEEESFFEKLQIPPKYRWLLYVIPLLLVLTALVVRGLLAPRFYRQEWVNKRFFHNRQRAQHYYQDILRQLTMLGCPLQTGDTLYELLTRFEDPADRTAASMERIRRSAYGAALRQAGTPPIEGAPAQTLRDLLQQSEALLRQGSVVEGLQQRLLPVAELLYAHLEPTDDGVAGLAALRAELETVLQAQMNPIAYFVRRRVLLPRTSRVVKRYK